MKKLFFDIIITFFATNTYSQSFETKFSKPLGQVLQEISSRFNVKLKYDADTTGKVVTYADFRIRPYSVESLYSVFRYESIFFPSSGVRRGYS